MNTAEVKVLKFPASEKKPAKQSRKSRRVSGCIYKRDSSPFWWLSLYVNGKKLYRCTELLNTVPQKQAEDALHNWREELRLNPIPQGQALTVSALADLYIADYKVKGQKSIGHAKSRWEQHLKPFFGLYPAHRVTPSLIDAYRLARTNEKASVATVNRELAALRRMFTLGKQKRLVSSVPFVPMVRENNTRVGFLADSDFALLAEQCSKQGAWMRALLECGATWGWRREELVPLKVSQVDLMRRTVRLEPGSTKNKEGRQVSMTDSIAELLRPLVVGKQRAEQVFTRENGTPVRSMRKAWQNACCSAGLGHFACVSCEVEFSEGKRCPKCKKRLVYRGLLFHDLRRTAARNLRNAGVDVSTVKKIGGWLTDSMFSRYSIVDAQDMQNAMQKLQSARAGNEISVTLSDTNSTLAVPRMTQ